LSIKISSSFKAVPYERKEGERWLVLEKRARARGRKRRLEREREREDKLGSCHTRYFYTQYCDKKILQFLAIDIY